MTNHEPHVHRDLRNETDATRAERKAREEAEMEAWRAKLAEYVSRKAHDSIIVSAEPEDNVIVIDRTPNVVIKNVDVRLWVGGVLFALSLLSGIAALTLGVFPEIEIGNAVVSRSIMLSNQIVSFLTGVFGLAVVVPNVPTKR